MEKLESPGLASWIWDARTRAPTKILDECFALNTAQEANGVSKLHGTVSQHMFQPVWKGYFEELHVSYVTNGIHLPSWASSTMKAMYEKHFGDTFYEDQSNPDIWKKIYDVSDNEIWNLRAI